MRTSSVAQAAFLLVLAAGTGSATRYEVTINNFGVKFRVFWFDDGGSEPYRIAFNNKGVYSAYTFDTLGELQTITVDGEEQEFSTSAEASGSSSGVGSRRLRAMQEDKKPEQKKFGHHHRRLFNCSDCGNTWDTMCDTGLVDVCTVSSSGQLTADAQTAVALPCSRFAKECDAATAEETCEDTCIEDTPEECDPNPRENEGECSADPAGGQVCSCASGYGGMSCQTDTSSLDSFYIEVDYVATWTDARQAVFQTAADSLLGAMTFDIDDIEDMEEDEIFEGVVLHEMGHVIGVGSSGFSKECSTCGTDEDPSWLCPAALSAYCDLGGTDDDTLELDGGSGTSCGHLDETIFDDELMTGYIDSEMYLSKMTAAILDDLDYTVDSSMVDSYTLPSERDDSITAEEGPSISINNTSVDTIIQSVNDDGTVEEIAGNIMVF